MLIKMQKYLIGVALVLFLMMPIWISLISPGLTKLPADFQYSADVISRDNFYDAEKGDYSGDIASDTIFSYIVENRKDDVLSIKNLFDVRTPDGDPIFVVERIYGIDRKTGRHIAGHGDKNRNGYLFAPRKLKAGDEYMYWHINYDEPAEMKFKEEVEIQGLPVFRYEANFNADQTDDLGHLLEVETTRGIISDINLQQWIEPITGRMVKYEDNTVAYYYNLSTGERIHPWNNFRNRFSDDSVTGQVRLAQNEKQKILLFEIITPVLFGLIGLALLISVWVSRRKDENSDTERTWKKL